MLFQYLFFNGFNVAYSLLGRKKECSLNMSITVFHSIANFRVNKEWVFNFCRNMLSLSSPDFSRSQGQSGARRQDIRSYNTNSVMTPAHSNATWNICFCPLTFFKNLGLNLEPWKSFAYISYSQLRYFSGVFKDLAVIDQVMFGAVD